MGHKESIKQALYWLFLVNLLTVSFNTNAVLAETVFLSKEYDDIKNIAIVNDTSSNYNENLAFIGQKNTYLVENKSPHFFVELYQNFNASNIFFDKKNIPNFKHLKWINLSDPCHCSIGKSKSKAIIKIKAQTNQINEQQKAFLNNYNFSCKASKKDTDLMECSKKEYFEVVVDRRVSSEKFKIIENPNIQKIRFSSNIYINNPFSGMNAGAIILSPIIVPVMAIGIGTLCAPEYIKGKKCSIRFG